MRLNLCKVVFAGFVPRRVFQPSSPSHAEVQLCLPIIGSSVCARCCLLSPRFLQVSAPCSVKRGGRGERLIQSFKSSDRRAGAKQFQVVQHLLDACEPESFCSFLESFWLGCVSWLVAVSALSASACAPPQPHACPCCSPWTREGCDKNKSRKRSSQWQLSAPHLITETLFAFLT